MGTSEQQLERWAKTPSETEEGKCQAAVARIRKAISDEFGDRVRIFLQGSYKNRTNIRLDSDVDIVACYQNVYYPDTAFLSEDETRKFHSSTSNAEYKFDAFKNKVEEILRTEFGTGEVKREPKCIKVKGNTYRVNADVVPAFVHKRLRTANPTDDHTEGVQLFTDDGGKVVSFPDHHYGKGAEKNQATDGNYKAAVRILKNIRNALIDAGTLHGSGMPSYSLECLVWNVDNPVFEARTYEEMMKAVVARVWHDMREGGKANDYAEVCDLLWLFRGNGRISPEQAEAFMLKAWGYLE